MKIVQTNFLQPKSVQYSCLDYFDFSQVIEVQKVIQEKIFPLRGRRPRSGNVFENHFLNQDNLGKMQLKTRKNVSSCIELEQYTKQSVFLYCSIHFLVNWKNGKKSRSRTNFFPSQPEKWNNCNCSIFRLTRKKSVDQEKKSFQNKFFSQSTGKMEQLQLFHFSS